MANFRKAVKIHRLFYLLICILIGCAKSKPEKDWTILIYMAADNSLNESALIDIAEMQSATFSGLVNVIVQIDHRNQDAVNDYTGGERWQIFPGTKKLINQLGEIDSGSSEVLADFIDWGFSNFKSHNKALVLWSHGNGWYDLYNKFCPDKTSLTSINIPDGDLYNALALANQSIDILIFDACNMQTIEVIAEVSQYAHYVIGSQDEIKVSGFPYQEILTGWETYITIQELAKGIAEMFVDSYFPFSGSQNPNGAIFPISCSVANAKLLPQLMQTLTNFTHVHNMQPEVLAFVRESCVEFNDPRIDVDMYQFFSLLQANIESIESENVILVLNALFIYNKAYYPHQNQLTLIDRSHEIGFAAIWFPQHFNEYISLNSIYQNLKFQQNSNWLDFLEYFIESNENLSTCIDKQIP
jgi:hypothetical protein